MSGAKLLRLCLDKVLYNCAMSSLVDWQKAGARQHMEYSSFLCLFFVKAALLLETAVLQQLQPSVTRRTI